MVFLIYRIGIFLSLYLPLKIVYKIAVIFSTVYYFISNADRSAVKANLRVIFPDYDEKTINRIAKEVFISFGKYLAEFFRFSKVDKNFLDKFVKVEGFENVKSALGHKKGVILCAAHLGNWELGAAAVSMLGVPFTVVALDHRHKRINDFFISQRRAKGEEVLSVNISLRRCFSALAENRSLALMGDRDYFDSGIEIEFFGKPTIIPKGPAVFSRRCGSPIVPTFMIRNKDNTFTFKFFKPIISPHTNNEHNDLVVTTKEFLRVIEQVIRQYPAQWCVFKRFWEKIGWERKTL